MTIYQVHGLAIETDVELDGCPEAIADTVDVRVTAEVEPEVAFDQPEGRLILAGVWPDDTPSHWGVACDDGGYQLRLPGALDVAVSADGRRAECRAGKVLPDGLLGVLIPGVVTSFLLRTRGELVLHASAVAVDGRAFAFTGNSGMGKTTVAALLCDHGAPLVTDDILHIRRGDEPAVYRGTGYLRLRRTTEELGLRMPIVRETPDGRHAVRPAPAEMLTPLAMIVIPLPDRENTSPVVTPVASRDAVALLRHYDHLDGWIDPAIAAHQFMALADLVAQVPVVTMTVPWGLPFSADAAPQLLDALAHASV